MFDLAAGDPTREAVADDIAVRLGGWVRLSHVRWFLRETFAYDHLRVEHAGGTQWAVRGGFGPRPVGSRLIRAS